MTSRPATCLLLRTNRFDDRARQFLERLERETGFEVAVAVDESAGIVDSGRFRKVSVTREAAALEGLYCPPDFAWRCGDYALYLARRCLPSVEHFWLIEPDVRVACHDHADFFDLFDPHTNVDLIAFDLRLSGADHLWHPTMRRRTREVYRCCFALCRFSAAAIDVCLAERRCDRRDVWMRLMWPNDETFTTTIATASGLRVRDANSFGSKLYTTDTFGFFTTRRGEDFEKEAVPGLVYHPVLWGDDFDRKQVKANRGVPTHEVIRLKILRGLMVRRYQRFLGLGGVLACERPIGRHV